MEPHGRQVGGFRVKQQQKQEDGCSSSRTPLASETQCFNQHYRDFAASARGEYDISVNLS
jgi:hypothetical protein